ncbi:FAD-dependent monooxygenase [Roseomonas sp. BN140053]|uniref:FAD-dependent monooxygenase n=1 Tax=Roseomonas sp. BN140053 TaxID=3391898 RepID=UPI0039E96C80
MNRPTRVAVIGAGIGGLAAAAALRQHGFAVSVHERANSLGEVGAGLQLGPNAVKVLRALGLEEALLRVTSAPENWLSVRWNDGGLRFRDPILKPGRDFGAPYLTAHRADLHRLLLGLVPEEDIRLGVRCLGAEPTAEGAVARFADGSTVEADVVVGADGIHSAVRESLFGRDQPRFTHQICWRAMIPIDQVPAAIGPGGSVPLGPEEYVGWLGPNGHVLCYPIRAGQTFNIFAGRVSDTWVDDSWAVPSSREELLEAYAGWDEALLDMFRVASDCHKWGIHDRDPLETWTRGRVTLLGDAAHPMMPTLAQGAAISIEDGYALARNLAAYPGDPSRGLAAYDAERVPRASRVQLQARQQFENNRKVPAPPPTDRDWIFAHDATRGEVPAATG